MEEQYGYSSLIKSTERKQLNGCEHCKSRVSLNIMEGTRTARPRMLLSEHGFSGSVGNFSQYYAPDRDQQRVLRKVSQSAKRLLKPTTTTLFSLCFAQRKPWQYLCFHLRQKLCHEPAPQSSSGGQLPSSCNLPLPWGLCLGRPEQGCLLIYKMR